MIIPTIQTSTILEYLNLTVEDATEKLNNLSKTQPYIMGLALILPHDMLLGIQLAYYMIETEMIKKEVRELESLVK